VLDTVHFMRTGQRLDLAVPGAWELDGYDTERRADVITSHDGPVDTATRHMLAAAYPGVGTWQARPANIDETYSAPSTAVRRLVELFGIEHRAARAILTVVSTEELDMRYVHGRFEITGNDDDQSFRIRSTDADAVVMVPVPREHAADVAAVLRDWDNAGVVTEACAAAADAITAQLDPGPVDNAGRPYDPPTWK
jgi:hypothetical protein